MINQINNLRNFNWSRNQQNIKITLILLYQTISINLILKTDLNSKLKSQSIVEDDVKWWFSKKKSHHFEGKLILNNHLNIKNLISLWIMINSFNIQKVNN
jgi:hypothetical protein